MIFFRRLTIAPYEPNLITKKIHVKYKLTKTIIQTWYLIGRRKSFTKYIRITWTSNLDHSYRFRFQKKLIWLGIWIKKCPYLRELLRVGLGMQSAGRNIVLPLFPGQVRTWWIWIMILMIASWHGNSVALRSIVRGLDRSALASPPKRTIVNNAIQCTYVLCSNYVDRTAWKLLILIMKKHRYWTELNPLILKISPTPINVINAPEVLTHWGRVTHICVSKLTIIGSDNGLSPGRHQAIIWTNAGILLIRPLGTNFDEMLIEILKFSFMKMRLKVSSAKWRPFCLGLNVLIPRPYRYNLIKQNNH